MTYDNFLNSDTEVDLSTYIKAGTEEQLNKQKRINLSIMAKSVTVFHVKNGEHYALEMTCKHHGANLSSVKPANNIVTCPRHGWKYDLTDGNCLKPPNAPSLRRHKVVVKDKNIYVNLHPESR